MGDRTIVGRLRTRLHGVTVVAVALVVSLAAVVASSAGASEGDDPRHPPEAGPIMSGADPSSTPAGDPDDYPDWYVELVGHRGLSPGFPENTLAAFANSVELGVDVIEIDLRGTADGEVVILHDETVDRTTDGTGDVTELTLEEVKQLDAGSWFSPEFAGETIPTYDEVLELVDGTGVKLLLDVKLSEVLDKERVVRLTESYGAQLDVIVGVRSVEDLREFRALNPNMRTLGFIAEPEDVDEFADAGVDIIRLWPHRDGWVYDDRDSARCRADVLRRQRLYERGTIDDPGSRSCLVQQVHDLGLPVWATANEDPYEDLDELVQLRFNAILTDLPEVMAYLQADIEELKAD